MLENQKTIEIELDPGNVKEAFDAADLPIYKVTIPIHKIDQAAEIDVLVEQRLRRLGIPTTNCKRCQKEIFFLTTKNGKAMPTTFALKSHFVDCPSAQNFRKPK